MEIIIECSNHLTGYLLCSPFFVYITIALGVWRICHMFAHERGPYGIFERLRFLVGTYYMTLDGQKIDNFDELEKCYETLERVDSTELAKLIECIWCSTPWLAALAVWAYLLSGQQVIIWCLLPFSVSAVAVITDRIVNG